MFGRLFGSKKGDAQEPKEAPGQTLSDIVRGIAHAAESANDIGDMAVLRQFKMFFDLDEKGNFVAKTARVKVDDAHYMDVPLVAIIDPGSMTLNEMDVKMAVRLTQTEVKQQLHAANASVMVQRSSFNVSLTGSKPGSRDDVIEVTMKFKKCEPQEGASRVIEELSNTIRTQKFAPATPPARDFSLTPQIRKETHTVVREPEDDTDFHPSDAHPT